MKQVIILSCALFASVSAMAQLRVNSDGHTTSRTMSIVKNNSDNAALKITTTGNDSLLNSMPSCLIATAAEVEVYPFIHYNNENSNPGFFVNGYGHVYSAQYVSFSDSIGKTNITPLESTLEKLKHLRGVSYHFKSDLKYTEQPDIMATTQEIQEQIFQERGRKRLGLIAQEVEQVFPEAVRTQFDGKKGIIYTDLIGVLIAAINEMDEKYTAKIEELQTQLNATQAILYTNDETLPQQKQTDLSSPINFQEALLHQNTPNPFNHTTSIAYKLPANIQSAAICIYNLNGQQLIKYDLETSAISGCITVDASKLPVGMYVYALIIEGHMTSSKRMILIE